MDQAVSVTQVFTWKVDAEEERLTACIKSQGEERMQKYRDPNTHLYIDQLTGKEEYFVDDPKVWDDFQLDFDSDLELLENGDQAA